MTVVRLADVRAALDDAGYLDVDHEDSAGALLGLSIMGYDVDRIGGDDEEGVDYAA